MRQLNVGKLQLQAGEEALNCVDGCFHFFLGIVDGCRDRRLDGVPYAGRSVLNAVEYI